MSMGTSRNPANADATRAGANDALRARARRNGWVLGLIALAFYLGFMVYIAIEGPR